MTSFSDRAMLCPCCGGSFETKVLRTMNFLGERTTDLRQRASGFQHIWFMVHTCPCCGYSGRIDDFVARKVNEDLRRYVYKNITPHLQVEESDYRSIVPGTKGTRYETKIMKWVFSGHKYEFAAKLAERRGASAWSIAWMLLNAAWCCVDFSRPEEEQAYRLKATDYFVRAHLAGNLLRADEITCMYLIAENYRRTGRKEQASEWYRKAIEMAMRQRGFEGILALAASQRDSPQETIQRGSPSESCIRSVPPLWDEQ